MEVSEMYRNVKEELAIYNQSFRHPELPLLEISSLYSLHPKRPEAMDTPHKWPRPYPNADMAGVYIAFGADMKLIYVGVASNLNTRVGSYFRYSSDDKGNCELRHDWSIEPAYLATIGVDEEAFFEAFALEKYLIFKFQPPENKRA